MDDRKRFWDQGVSRNHSTSRVGITASAAILVSLASGGCSDTLTEPQENTVTVAEGLAVSSIWNINEPKLDYVGSTSFRLAITRRDSTLSGKSSEIRSFQMDLASIELNRFAIQPSGLNQVLAEVRTASVEVNEGAKKPEAVIRPAYAGTGINFKGDGGKDFRLQIIEDKRRRGHPPRAMMIYVNGRPLVRHEFSYEPRGKDWKPVRERSTVFADNGKPLSVVDTDLKGVDAGTSSMVLASSALEGVLAKTSNRLLQMALPDAAYAASLMNTPCSAQYAAAIAATIAAATATAALVIATLECKNLVVSECAKIPMYAVNVATTGAAVVFAYKAYQNCLHPCVQEEYSREAPQTSQSVSVAEDPWCSVEGDDNATVGGVEGTCYREDWEISYDGGYTWSFLGSYVVCYTN